MTSTIERASGAPLFDPWALSPHLAALRAACDAKDAAAILAFLREATSSDELSYAMWLVADVKGIESCLEAAVEADPAEPLGRTVLALRYVTVGWDIRTRARARHVSAEQFAQFHDWLGRAERLLAEVCADEPAFVPAWEARLTTSRGLELGQAEARRRYDRLAAVDPHHVFAQSVYLQQAVPKWGGSWEAAEAFIAASVEHAPPGSLSHRLVAELELERWIEDDGSADRLKDPVVVERLRAAALASVWHPEHVPSPGTVRAHSLFAFLFSEAGRHADAAPHFRAAGESPSDSGWVHTHAPEGFYRRARALALGEKPVPPVPAVAGGPSPGAASPKALVLAYLVCGSVAAFFAFIGVMTLTEEPVDAGSWQIAGTMLAFALGLMVFPVWAHVRAARLKREAGL